MPLETLDLDSSISSFKLHPRHFRPCVIVVHCIWTLKLFFLEDYIVNANHGSLKRKFKNSYVTPFRRLLSFLC